MIEKERNLPERNSEAGDMTWDKAQFLISLGYGEHLTIGQYEDLMADESYRRHADQIFDEYIPLHTRWAEALEVSDASPELLGAMTRSSDVQARQYLAYNPHTPEWVLEILSCDTDNQVRGAVARHASTRVETLSQLSFDDVLDVRQAVARRRDIPADLAEDLARNPHYDVRCNLALNPDVPPHLLGRLARDEDLTVRTASARNPATPNHSLVRLTVSGGNFERHAVKSNPGASAPMRRIAGFLARRL